MIPKLFKVHYKVADSISDANRLLVDKIKAKTVLHTL